MTLTVDDRDLSPSAPLVCAVDGMPLYSTIVGPRCPLCGAQAVR